MIFAPTTPSLSTATFYQVTHLKLSIYYFQLVLDVKWVIFVFFFTLINFILPISSPDAEVKIDCKFKAVSPRTTEQISLSVNRTTNKFGVYKLEIPSIEGIKCAEDSAIVSSCQASLIRSSSSSCNIPGYKATSDEIAIKSKRANLCFYSLTALNFRPSTKKSSFCGK